MASNDLKMTSNELKMTSNEPVKNKRNKLKRGDPSGIHISGKDLIEQAFSSNQKKEFIEIMKKDTNLQNDISQTISKSTTKNHFQQDLK